jgi:hypothetical protein
VVYGLQAISNANGWSMAFAGALIVFSGLVVLSFVISQLHKIVTLWENRGRPADSPAPEPARSETEPAAAETVFVPQSWPTEPREEALLYAPLLADLGGTVQLADLYQACRRHDFPHPHLSINRLREAGYLVDAGDGKVDWVAGGN